MTQAGLYFSISPFPAITLVTIVASAEAFENGDAMSTETRCVDREPLPVHKSREVPSPTHVEPLVFSRRVAFAAESSMGSTTDCRKTNIGANGDWGPDD